MVNAFKSLGYHFWIYVLAVIPDSVGDIGRGSDHLFNIKMELEA